MLGKYVICRDMDTQNDFNPTAGKNFIFFYYLMHYNSSSTSGNLKLSLQLQHMEKICKKNCRCGLGGNSVKYFGEMDRDDVLKPCSSNFEI
jgi:hypothetical protein